MKQSFILYIFVVLLAFIATGCGKGKNLDSLSPKEVVDLYYQARNDGDIELLQQIIYFPPDISEAQRKERLELAGADEKGVMRAVGAKIKAEYEKILDDDTAEVGVVMFVGIPGLKRRVPFQQVILKKDNSIWKYSHSKHELTEDHLIAAITKNPYDASAIFHLGRRYQPENPARASRYYRKYHELEPNGFWISEELLDRIEGYESVEREEKKLLEKLKYTPEKSSRRASVYLTLGQLFTEHEDYKKAEIYFDQAEKVLDLLCRKALIFYI